MFSASTSIFIRGERDTGQCRRTVGHPYYFCARETDTFPRHFRHRSRTISTLYSSLRPFSRSNPENVFGATFGLDFSADGSMLGAAMEKRGLLFFDSLNRKLISSVVDAHADCINAIKFLDNRIFASCSDDKLVKLWDLRNPKRCIRTLSGHTNWVKNIEYDQPSGLLLTSSFDGYIYSWNVNNFESEAESSSFKPIFYTPGLLRSRLTLDSTKLILSTQWGYLMVVHNLDLQTCYQDLAAFKPNLYWLMLKSGAKFANCEENLKHFESKRNRVELILDFPQSDDPDNITSITPHPQSWCVLSRNTNHDENSEWTCIHDIQLPAEHEMDIEDVQEPTTVPTVRLDGTSPATSEPRVSSATTSSGRTIIAIEMLSTGDEASAGTAAAATAMVSIAASSRPASPSSDSDATSDTNNEERPVVAPTNHRSTLNVATTTEPRAIFLPQDPLNPQQRLVLILPSGSNIDRSSRMSRNQLVTSANYTERRADESSAYRHDALPKTYRRLLYYAQEPNVGRGYIKEQSFSSDGRLIASPYGFGVRLLAFSADCREMCDCDVAEFAGQRGAKKARKLVEAGVSISHGNVVLCTKFSPSHTLLASGCLGGNVSFYQPVL